MSNQNILNNHSIADRDRPSIRSRPNKELSFVRFLNLTQREVEVIWISFEGVRVRYKTLGPLDYFDVNTYAAHPWIFQDAKTREYLLANSKDIYEPTPWYQEYLPDLHAGRMQPKDIKPKRITINITSPLYSLKLCAMNAIIQCLSNYDSLVELELPVELLEELNIIKNSRN